MKWVLRLFGLVLVLAIAAGVIGYLYIETIIVNEAEKIASRELGVKTTIGSFSIGWLDKSVTAKNVKIYNPDGFETPYFVKVPRVDVSLSEKILNDPIVIDSIVVNGLSAFYEVGVKGNNLRAIQKNMLKSANSKPQTSEKSAKADDGGKNVIIKDLQIKDASLVPAITVAGQTGQQSVKIPLIRMRNIGTTNDPASKREVVLKVMTALTGAIQNGALPQLVVNSVADEAVKQINKASEAINGAIGGAVKGLFGK